MVSIAESEFWSRSASHWTRRGGKSAMMVEPLWKKGCFCPLYSQTMKYAEILAHP